MTCPLKSPDDDNRRSLSALLRDVSDDHLKRLRSRTVRKIMLENRATDLGKTLDADARRR
jgi:hypothetical protein